VGSHNICDDKHRAESGLGQMVLGPGRILNSGSCRPLLFDSKYLG
jgi:hypothetical protein